MKAVSRVRTEDTRQNISGHCGSRGRKEGLKIIALMATCSQNKPYRDQHTQE